MANSPQFIVDIKLHTNALELITIVVAVKLWGTFLRGKKLVINTDSSVSCHVLNSGFSRDHFLQSCLREICFYAALYEFQIKANFLQGVSNRLPDWLSRWHMKPCYKFNFYESVKMKNWKSTLLIVLSFVVRMTSDSQIIIRYISILANREF